MVYSTCKYSVIRVYRCKVLYMFCKVIKVSWMGPIWRLIQYSKNKIKIIWLGFQAYRDRYYCVFGPEMLSLTGVAMKSSAA